MAVEDLPTGPSIGPGGAVKGPQWGSAARGVERRRRWEEERMSGFREPLAGAVFRPLAPEFGGQFFFFESASALHGRGSMTQPCINPTSQLNCPAFSDVAGEGGFVIWEVLSLHCSEE